MLVLIACGGGETSSADTTPDDNVTTEAPGVTDGLDEETTVSSEKAPTEETTTPEEATTEPVFTEPPEAPQPEDFEGFSFDANGTCKVSRGYAKAPHTVSAWIRLEKDFDERAGAILSNSNQSIKSCISFEIHKDGNPYFCYLDKTYVEHKFRFEDVDVRTGEWLYLTVVINPDAGYARCYINGVLAQQMNESPNGQPIKEFSPSVTTVPFSIGGDNQEGNPQFFAGDLKELALFFDARSTAEVRGDYTNGVANDAEGLMALYDLRGKTQFGTIADESEHGYDFVCHRDFYDDSQSYKGEYAYSVAIVGDTQTLTFYSIRGGAYRDSLTNLYQWIIDNKNEKNIQYVLGLGDITETGVDDDHRNYNPEKAAAEWSAAKAAITMMDGLLPYSLVRGSGHDGVEYFNEYFAGHEGYTANINGYYQDGRIENVYHTFTVGDTDYLILCLDFGAKDPVLEWASGVLEAHPAHKVIVTTHAYLEKDGSLLETGEEYCPSQSYYDPENNDGDDLWEKFVRKHENISMVISGHMSAETVVLSTQTGDHGNEVLQVLIDPQTIDKEYSGGTGMVAMFYFSEESELVAVEYYSTVRDAYKPLQLFGIE